MLYNSNRKLSEENRMRYLSTYIIFIVVFLLSCGSADKSIKKGDMAYGLGEYNAAATHYKKAYSRLSPKERTKRGEVAYKMAECYRQFGFSSRALGSYKNAERYKFTDTLTYFYEGEMMRLMGDYKGAEKAYSLFLEKYPDHEAAKKGLASCASAPDLKKKGSAYTVSIERVFNASRSDYAPAYMGTDAEQIYFTTTRPQTTGDDLSDITGQKNGDIFFAKKDEKGKWKVPEAVDANVNTEFDEGACSFSADGRTMYFTLCKTDEQYPRMAEIWKSERTDASWGKPEQIKITADTLSSYAHPSLSPDGQWLYFTSDMPGGYGGLDLWRVSINSHGVGAVENLGETINTSGNESFPAFRPTGELYFSSDGHVGMGGLDLFRATEDTVAHKWSVVHLPAPMNSNADDFGITFEGFHNRGFFSSGRSTKGRGWDKIFSFSYPEVMQTVKGWVYEQDGYELPEAVVYMVGNDGTNLKLGLNSDGSFEQPLKPGVHYLFLATCKGYLNYKEELKADSAEVEKQFVLQFPLPSISVPVLVRNVFYEFDKADITENSKEALDRLTKMLKENPNITIELSAHCDNRGNDEYNEKLSQRRSESVVKYLTEQGIQPERLTAKGYGEKQPKVVNKKLLEAYPFLHENDTLTENYILQLTPEQQEVCHALNRRTEFKVLRTTFGLFDEQGNLKPEALKPGEEESDETSEEF